MPWGREVKFGEYGRVWGSEDVRNSLPFPFGKGKIFRKTGPEFPILFLVSSYWEISGADLDLSGANLAGNEFPPSQKHHM